MTPALEQAGLELVRVQGLDSPCIGFTTVPDTVLRPALCGCGRGYVARRAGLATLSDMHRNAMVFARAFRVHRDGFLGARGGKGALG